MKIHVCQRTSAGHVVSSDNYDKWCTVSLEEHFWSLQYSMELVSGANRQATEQALLKICF